MNSRNQQRFSKPGVLESTTRVLGATAQQWDKALTGNFVETLEGYRSRAKNMNLPNSPKSTAGRRVSGDVASAAKSVIIKKTISHG